MKINIKQTTIVLVVLAMLSACGGDNNDNDNKNKNINHYVDNNNASSGNFNPKTAKEFESKFVNKTINPPSGNVITILPNNRIRQTIKHKTTGESTYTYESINSSTVAIKYVIGDINCIIKLSWTSELGGSAIEEYTSNDFSTHANGTFFINGKN